VQQLYAVLPAPYRSPVARYSFKHVYVDASEAGLYKAREMVSFTGREFTATVGDGGGRRVEEETLDEYGFIKGDLISVAVGVPEPPRKEQPPRDAGRRAPPSRAAGGWRDRDAPRRDSNDRWGRRSRSRSPGRGDSWRGRD
jgi:histone deacetylase complex subunit SAP18